MYVPVLTNRNVQH